MFDATERFLCLASSEKGHDFLRKCAELGVRPTLLARDTLRDAAWPREVLEDLAPMPPGLTRDQILNTVCGMSRERRFDRIVALDDGDLETAAYLREQLRIPGMGITTAAYYRDRLAMRMSARDSGFPVPEFCRVLNYGELREYMNRVPPPWLLKPRIVGSAERMRRIDEPQQLWSAVNELGNRRNQYLLEKFVRGDVFHVDAIVSECDVPFSVVHRCRRQPMDAGGECGVLSIRTVDRGSRDWMELIALNAGLAPSFGMVRGITHAEYLRGDDGGYYFLEIAARVGGAFFADLVEVSTGVNLWREWAQLEVGHLRGKTYLSPEWFDGYAGSVLCLAPEGELDTGDFRAPEIVVRMNKNHHSGLILRSLEAGRIEQLVEEYSGEFARRLLARRPAGEPAQAGAKETTPQQMVLPQVFPE